MKLTKSDSSRVRAFIFDLDGTLVETERLKAKAYAVILGRLTGANAPDRRAIELYERNVGATDEMICRKILYEFGIENALPTSDSEPWRVLHEIRMDEYRENLGTAENLLADSYANNISLLKSAKAQGYRVAVAT
ncbi:MAG: HAD hydrolase-like protein, partial [Dehalococcoidia bacterium]